MAEPIVLITAEGPTLSADIHGAKACGLQRLMRLDLPVPPAFVIPVASAPDVAAGGMADELERHVTDLCAGINQPRLAVRSGAEVSLPGAFETLLDVHPEVVAAAVHTVVSSTKSLRAMAIANTLGHDHVPPTAVIVQRQVDATVDRRSGAGAATSRDLFGGGNEPTGSFAWQIQGDAVMAGTAPVVSLASIADRCPEALSELGHDLGLLESDLGSAAEVEFAIESGRLWYLQVRPVRSTEISEPTPLPDGTTVIGSGRPAAPGRGEGELATDIDDAVDAIDSGRRVVLALGTTSPSEVAVMARSAAIFTAVGSPECHAAVVARAAGIPAVVSVKGLEIHPDHVMVEGTRVEVGEMLWVDGTTGQVASATVTS